MTILRIAGEPGLYRLQPYVRETEAAVLEEQGRTIASAV